MTCEDAHLKMHDYISGELPAVHHKPLMDHLDDCPNCKKFFMQTKQLQATVKSAMHVEAPGDLVETVTRILANA